MPKASVVVFYADLLVSGIATPPRLTRTTPRPKLTPHELSRIVTLIGQGCSLQRAIDQIQAERPTLPFEPPEAA